MFKWFWRLINGASQIPTEPQSVGRPEVDDQKREAVVRNRRAVPAKKSNTSVKPTGVRSNNQSKTGRKSTGAAVRAAAAKGKSKSKTVPKD